MLIYVSGPMRGLPEYNYPAFHDAAAVLRGRGHQVLNPAETAGGATDLPYTTYLRIDVGYVQAADAVAVLPGWQDSKGALLEVHIAHALEKPVYAYVSGVGLGPRLDLSDWSVFVVETFGGGVR